MKRGSPGASPRRRWGKRVPVGAVALVAVLAGVGYLYQPEGLGVYSDMNPRLRKSRGRAGFVGLSLAIVVARVPSGEAQPGAEGPARAAFEHMADLQPFLGSYATTMGADDQRPWAAARPGAGLQPDARRRPAACRRRGGPRRAAWSPVGELILKFVGSSSGGGGP